MSVSARLGMLVAACGALMWIASMMNSVVDPNVTEHKPIYSFTVMLVCGFCVFVLLASVTLGAILGALVGKLLPRSSNRTSIHQSTEKHHPLPRNGDT
jgi:hypothetical protein